MLSSVREYKCYYMEEKHIVDVYNILEPLIVNYGDKRRQEYMFEIIKAYAFDHGSAIIVLRDKDVVGVSLYGKNNIEHFASKYRNHRVGFLMIHTIVNIINVKERLIAFSMLNNKDSNMFMRTWFQIGKIIGDKSVIINKRGKNTIKNMFESIGGKNGK